MEILGKIILYIILGCLLLGAVASVVREESGLGKAFEEGFSALTALFLPLAGLMVSLPYLASFAELAFGDLYRAIGADPAIAASTFIPSDTGGYMLAHLLAASPETWIMAYFVGFMAAPTILFNIPVGLYILEKKDHRYLALGTMAGFLSVPFGVLAGCLILILTRPTIREVVSGTGPATYQLNLSIATVLINLLPLVVVCGLFALGLRFIPDKMIKGFLIYGKLLMSALKLIMAFCIVEYFTGIFSSNFTWWRFDPFMADEADLFRALEVTGNIAVMLAGVFPMVYLIKTYLSAPLRGLGRLLGLSEDGSAGVLAGAANVVALFLIVKDLAPKDKIKCMAFTVAGGYLLGDYLAYSANFQPNLLVPLVCGQLIGGVTGIILANIFSLPYARREGLLDGPLD